MIPAAGLGTRFLPATKELPKELLPVLDRPVIQWAAEEAVASGADEIVLVLAEGKEALVAQGLEPEPGPPGAVTERIRSDIEKWRGVVAKAGISP